MDLTPDIASVQSQVPVYAAFSAGEDISSAFELMLIAERDRHMLTVVPPVKLQTDMFTTEEFKGWEYTDDEIETGLMLCPASDPSSSHSVSITHSLA